MSRRGGHRRHVLQLGDSGSQLHRYGYSKGFQSAESSVQGNALTGLVGDYSDSDSDDNSPSDQPVVSQNDPKDGTSPPPTTDVQVQDPPESKKSFEPEDDPMDDELRNFLSEIEAIPMPDENNKTPDNLSEGGPSPTPTNQIAVQVKTTGDSNMDDVSSTFKTISDIPSKKKSSVTYSMFVKGDVEFANSPSPTPTPSSEAANECQEKTKVGETTVTESDFLDIPEEPTTRWQMVQDEATQFYYYWNWQTNEVTWEIPSDYTQYLLMHKEYEEKMAKIPAHVLQAWRDSKAGKKPGSNDNSSNSLSTSTGRGNDVITKSTLTDSITKSHLEGKQERDEDRYTYHHHKKKKSKKHKRRRNSDSGDDLDEKYLRNKEDKSLTKSKKTKVTIGPQPLSIVPYMSDDNDEDSDNDGDQMERKKAESNTETLTESASASKSTKFDSKSPSPDPVSNVERIEETKDEKTDFDSLVQNLVDFHDKMTLPGPHVNGSNTSENVNETTNDVGEIEKDKGSEESKMDGNDEGKSTTDEFIVESKHSETVKEDELTKEYNKVDDVEHVSESPSKDKERQNIFDQFSVINDEDKKKKKKKVINMFAEDSQSEVDETVNGDDKGTKTESKVTRSKSEMEDGEISDGLESLSNATDGNSRQLKETQSMELTDKNVHSSDEQASSLKIEGCKKVDEDEEEEEGELKEEVTKIVEVEEKDVTEGPVPKKRVLQYKDYMKKYRSDKFSTSLAKEPSESEQSSSISTMSRPSVPVETVEEKDVKEENIVQAVTNQVEENGVKEEEEHRKEEKKVDVADDNDDDTEEDIDFDDLDDIDRVLEKALEKKREQKTDIKEEINGKAEEVQETPCVSSSVSSSETKKTENESLENPEMSVDASGLSDTDMKRLKYAVKDSAELALHKLQFLDISTKNLSKLQVLLVELQTRYNDWQSGGLSTLYFHKQLKCSEALLSQYEESAVPTGWSCRWDRASCRYFYRNEHSGHTQWEYPQVGAGAESTTNTSTKVKGGEVKDSNSSRGRGSKKRRSKDVEEREKEREREDSSKSRAHNSSSRSNRSHRSSKKVSDKDRGKRERHSSSSHHHRKKKRRRRDHSSSSSSSEDENSHSHHRHKSKRKKKGRSDKSPSLELVDYEGPEQHAQIIEDSPPPSMSQPDSGEDKVGIDASGEGGDPGSLQSHSKTLGLIADYGSDQDVEEEELEGEEEGRTEKRNKDENCDRLDKEDVAGDEGGLGNGKTVLEELEDIDGVEMDKTEGDEEVKEEEEEETVNSAVIVKPPQIIVPPYVAAMNQPQMYSTPALYTSTPFSHSTTTTTTSGQMEPTDHEPEQGEATTSTAGQTSEEAEKAAGKKKKKEKYGKEKSLSANSSIMMKKKRVSSMVQKWQQVKKEVEKENRDKELRQAAIREKINQLKST